MRGTAAVALQVGCGERPLNSRHLAQQIKFVVKVTYDHAVTNIPRSSRCFKSTGRLRTENIHCEINRWPSRLQNISNSEMIVAKWRCCHGHGRRRHRNWGIYTPFSRDLGTDEDKFRTALMSNRAPSKSVFSASSPILGHGLRYPMY